MLSDLSDDTKYGISMSGGHTASGNTTINSAVLGLRWKILDWFMVTGSIPYSDIKSKEKVQYTDGSTGNLHYNQDGFGDISVMGWANIAYPFLDLEKKEVDPELGDVPAEDPLSGIGDPMVFFGAGMKFSNASFDERTKSRYLYDRDRATFTGERSMSDGAIPAYYQLGTGEEDILLGLFYQQRFGRISPTLALSYTFDGGKNGLGYERGDKFSWTVGSKYCIRRWPDCSQLYFRGGINGLIVLEADYDHSNDITVIGDADVGKIDDTKGSYNFYNFGFGYDLGKQVSFVAAMQLPLTTHNNDSDNSFDRSVSLSLQYKF